MGTSYSERIGSAGSSGVAGYGAPVRGFEMRVVARKAVNRALRTPYGIGVGSIEELASFADPANRSHGSNHSSYSQPRLRDQLCLLIRRHGLDPNVVKHTLPTSLGRRL
jgi:hypothetical protein